MGRENFPEQWRSLVAVATGLQEDPASVHQAAQRLGLILPKLNGGRVVNVADLTNIAREIVRFRLAKQQRRAKRAKKATP